MSAEQSTTSSPSQLRGSAQRDAADARDMETLRQHGLQFGYEASLRQRVYLLLLDAQVDDEDAFDEMVTPHADEQQVLLDTHRSFVSCMPASVQPAHVSVLRDELQRLICRVLRRHPWLHYYQGFHDIAQLVLLVAGRKQAVAVALLDKLATHALRDFMLSTLAPSMSMLPLAHDIVKVYDPDLRQLLESVEPYFAVSPLLTWFLHNLESYSDACRVLDLLVASDDPAMILYLIAAQTILRKQQVKEADGDPDLIFHVLSRPRQHDDAALEVWLQLAVKLHEGIRPKQLRHWSRISRHSSLKTKSSITSDEAKEHAVLQEAQVAEAERKRRVKESGGLGSLWVRLLEEEPGRFGVAAVTVGLLAAGLTLYLKS
ncbi:rab-GTPase-TBC domain-domain-containing protein [Protomyces lactucae-debilis]|uniref:Rab-GTPase-TBC domain-domain-containing protein n=1 Tax=Protomyces lactucae-debilis TaxID=2754530 RepID=A0A1Y2FF88_PROLT|nr:rab-GTPase-TBC domain-containing protein [Protomyces lactucae-debilis]ORY82608.1 rab-GTPase-TBC domain-domain-containing protein [Protomyces lactucae-debilis]